jgi:hypothetical protein
MSSPSQRSNMNGASRGSCSDSLCLIHSDDMDEVSMSQNPDIYNSHHERQLLHRGPQNTVLSGNRNRIEYPYSISDSESKTADHYSKSTTMRVGSGSGPGGEVNDFSSQSLQTSRTTTVSVPYKTTKAVRQDIEFLNQALEVTDSVLI